MGSNVYHDFFLRFNKLSLYSLGKQTFVFVSSDRLSVINVLKCCPIFRVGKMHVTNPKRVVAFNGGEDSRQA